MFSDAKPTVATPNRTYNLPTANEVAMIVCADMTDPESCPKSREVFIRLQENVTDKNTINTDKSILNKSVRRIDSISPHYDPLAYVITHMHGDFGFHIHINKYDPKRNQYSFKKITALDYYAYRTQIRSREQDTLLYGGMLSQQYLCDMYVKYEINKLHWLRKNQDKLKVNSYQGLVDAIAADDVADCSQSVILPSTVIGSPRHAQQCYQDAMAIVAHYGKPTLFITFTCNPKWPEISNAMKYDHSNSNRPDIIARVFKVKLTELLDDLVCKAIFGVVLANVHVVEFQKRGLPHAHMLMIVREHDKPKTADDYDKIVSAELPDPIKQPELYKLVTEHMLHGPCGECNKSCPCMNKDTNTCEKRFPKEYCSMTSDTADSYPEYRRRSPAEGGFTTSKKGVVMDNRWVVPYNAWLLLKYQSHINVEICCTVKAVKYLFKYVYKGPDKTSMKLQALDANNGLDHLNDVPTTNNSNNNNLTTRKRKPINEIENYINARYICPSEAVWKFHSFKMGDHYPNVQRLQIHLENQQTVTFREDRAELAVQDVVHTTLTGYFEIIKKERDHPLTDAQLGKDPVEKCLYKSARELTYHQFPLHYTWLPGKREWKRRVKNSGAPTIGRMYSVHELSGDGEKFFLRLLLTIVKDKASFEEIRTIDGHVFNTYKETCSELGLVGDDKEFYRCLNEAKETETSRKLCHLFTLIIVHNTILNHMQLWNTFKDELSNDFKHERVCRIQNPTPYEKEFCEEDYNECLYVLNNMLRAATNAEKTLESYHLPMPNYDMLYDEKRELMNPTLVESALNYDTSEQEVNLQQSLMKMNVDQLKVYEAVTAAIDRYRAEMNNVVITNDTIGISNTNVASSNVQFDNVQTVLYHKTTDRVFFIDAFGGTGKTFVCNAILSYARSQGQIAIAVSSSGISAVLLKDGTTAHSRLKIPIPIAKESFCNVTARSQTGQLLIQSTIIIWDEATMTERKTFEAFDRTLRELMKNKKIFGGKVMVMGGDFRQTLPVIPRQGRAGVMAEIVKKSPIWKSVQKYSLTINERVKQFGHQSPGMQCYADFLLKVGNGEIEYEDDIFETLIRIPDEYVFEHQTIDELLTYMYSTEDGNISMSDKAILTPKNEDVDLINEIAIKKMDGDMYTCESCNTAIHDDHLQAHLYTTEFMQSINGFGLPPHKLLLKLNAPIILLRNLDQRKGLCNGTRLKVLQISQFRIKAEIMSGSHVGDIVSIPRILCSPNNAHLPFVLQRRQFPIKLAFALTINKAQGQSLKKAGIYLPSPVFTHGQLYVALSRCGCPENMKILIKQVDGIQGKFAKKPGTYTRNIVYPEALSFYEF